MISDEKTAHLLGTFMQTLPTVTQRNQPTADQERLGSASFNQKKQNTSRVKPTKRLASDVVTNADSLVSYDTNPSIMHPTRTPCQGTISHQQDQQYRQTSAFFEGIDSKTSAMQIASMNSEIRMNALAFNLTNVQNISKFGLARKIFESKYQQKQMQVGNRQSSNNESMEHKHSRMVAPSANSSPTQQSPLRQRLHPKIRNMFAQPSTRIKHQSNRTSLPLEMQVRVKATFEIINKNIEERNAHHKKRQQTAAKLIGQVCDRINNVHGFDYELLKEGIRQQKEALLAGKKPIGKIYEDPDDLKRAINILKLQKENQLICILHKVNENKKVNTFWNTTSIRALANEIKSTDKYLSDELLELCNTEQETELRDFLQSLLQDRNKEIIDEFEGEFYIPPELDENQRRKIIKGEFVKSMVKEMQVKKKKELKQKPTEQVLRNLSFTKNQKLKMLINQRVLAVKPQGKEDLRTINIKTLIGLIRLSQQMNEVFGEASLNDYYKQCGNIYSNPTVFDNEELANQIQKVWYQTNKDMQCWPPQEIASLIEEPVLSQMFMKTTKSIKFFKDCKNQTMPSEYLKNIEAKQEIGIPDFVKIFNNVLYISEMRLGPGQLLALVNYIKSLADPDLRYEEVSKNKKVRSRNLIQTLRIDNCDMQDEDLAAILLAVRMHCHLEVFEYLNNQIGLKSMTILTHILNSDQSGIFLRELRLVNLTGLNKSLISSLLSGISKCQTLLKLKLSFINLADDKSLQHLLQFLSTSKTLSHFDLSWSHLSTKQLTAVVRACQENSQQLRHLNLSYKNIASTFRTDLDRPQLEKQILEFVEALKTYISQSVVLNHLDLSGIDFAPGQLKELSEVINQSPVLLSVHFNDMELNSNLDLARDLLDIFGIERSRFDELKEKTVNKPVFNSSQIKRTLYQICKPLNSRKMQDYEQFVEMKHYQDYLFKGHQRIKVKEANQQASGSHSLGVGRQPLPHDNFVITRKLEYPELCFNQNKHLDQYFEQDAYKQWFLSEKGECYLCFKHKLATIYYDPETAKHKFTEIEDKNFKNFLKVNLNLNSIEFKMSNPIVLGTVTGGWNRKLRMMDACVYALLAVSERDELKWDHDQVQELKKDIVEVINHHSLEDLVDDGNQGDGLDLRASLTGFQNILQDKLTLNKEIDQMAVGLPNMDIDHSDKHPYIFSDFLPAGHHIFIIYDPESDKFWTSDFFLDFNSQDITYTVQQKKKVQPKKVITNVWRPWADDKPKDLIKIYDYDMKRENPNKGQRFFQPALLIPDKSEITNLHRQFEKNYKIILTMFKEIHFGSASYPEINFKDILEFFQQIQSDKFFSLNNEEINEDKADKIMNEELKLDKDGEIIDEAADDSDDDDCKSIGDARITIRSFENAFICSNRLSTDRSLRGTLNRSEWLNFILRLIQYRYKLRVKKKEAWVNVSQYLADFINDYFALEFNTSEIFTVRAFIRASSTLNELLQDNKKFLTNLFDLFKDKTSKKFSRSSAEEMLKQYIQPIYDRDLDDFNFQMRKIEHKKKESQKNIVDMPSLGDHVSIPDDNIGDLPKEPMHFLKRIQMFFSFSQMTIINEQKNRDRYFELNYVEFLEMVCRAAYFIENQSKNGMKPVNMDDPVPIYDSVYKFMQRLQQTQPLHDFYSKLQPPNPEKDSQLKNHIKRLSRAASTSLSISLTSDQLENLQEEQKVKLLKELNKDMKTIQN